MDDGASLPIALIVVSYIALLFSLCVHEAAHAVTSNWCGDPSARLLGRITLNPIMHADPIGTVAMPLLMMFSGIPFLFGWAKPVPVNPLNLKDPQRDQVLIALAGPLSNILLLVLTAIAARVSIFVGATVSNDSPLFILLATMLGINFILAVFNCIPVPPLDGHYVLNLFLPPEGQRMLQQIGPFGILIAILVSRPLFTRLDPLLTWIMQTAFGVGGTA